MSSFNQSVIVKDEKIIQQQTRKTPSWLSFNGFIHLIFTVTNRMIPISIVNV